MKEIEVKDKKQVFKEKKTKQKNKKKNKANVSFA